MFKGLVQYANVFISAIELGLERKATNVAKQCGVHLLYLENWICGILALVGTLSGISSGLTRAICSSYNN